MTQEALKLALVALEEAWIFAVSTFQPTEKAIDLYDEARAAIKEALAQPEQEPVAWGVDWGKAGDIACVSIIKRLPNDVIEVVAVEYAPYSYTHPPQRTWVGLTDGEFHEACWESYVDPVTGECSTGDREYAVRWTEAKLKEKNT
jgi:hypothetical protein